MFAYQRAVPTQIQDPVVSSSAFQPYFLAVTFVDLPAWHERAVAICAFYFWFDQKLALSSVDHIFLFARSLAPMVLHHRIPLVGLMLWCICLPFLDTNPALA